MSYVCWRVDVQDVLKQVPPGQQRRQRQTLAIPVKRAAEKSRSPARCRTWRVVCQLARLVRCCCGRRPSMASSSSKTTVVPANWCWQSCREHHALSSMLLVVGVCRGPSLLVEVGVVGDQGIVDSCPISWHGRQWQLVRAAHVQLVIVLSPSSAERQTLSYTAVLACSCSQALRKCLSALLAYARQVG